MGLVIQQISGYNHTIFLLEYDEATFKLTFDITTSEHGPFTEEMVINGDWCETPRLKFEKHWFDKWQKEIEA